MKKVGRGIQIESDKGSLTSLHEMMGFEYWKGPQAHGVWIHILFLLLFSFTLDISLENISFPLQSSYFRETI
jgi:hypothetical protein